MGQTYTVWFRNGLGNECVFVSSVPGERLADNIVMALMQEDFVRDAWYEED